MNRIAAVIKYKSISPFMVKSPLKPFKSFFFWFQKTIENKNENKIKTKMKTKMKPK
jgi:hypothetical protein